MAVHKAKQAGYLKSVADYNTHIDIQEHKNGRGSSANFCPAPIGKYKFTFSLKWYILITNAATHYEVCLCPAGTGR